MTSPTPIYDAVVEAHSYTPGEVKLMTHKEFMAHNAEERRKAKAAAKRAGRKPRPKS